MTRGDLDEEDATCDLPVFKTAATFCGEYTPLAYVLEPIVRTSALYTLTARTGAGKTALAIIATLAVATGRSAILGMPVEPGRIAYLTFENPDDFRMRLSVAAYRLDIDLAALGDRYVILDARAPPEAIRRQLISLTAVGGDFTLVIVDTLAAAFDGRDINDNVESGNFIRRLRPLTTLPGLPAVIVAAHPTKNASDDALVPYGGGAILNEVDGNLTLSQRSDTTLTTLHWSGKFRGLEFAPRSFKFEAATAPEISDRYGRLVPLPLLRPVAKDDAAVASEREANVDRAILRCLSEDPVPGVREIGERVQRSKSVVATKLARLGREKLAEKVIDRWQITAKGRRVITSPAEGQIDD